MGKIILGIDPGSRITGYGVIEAVGTKLTYITSGVIEAGMHDEPFAQRLVTIYDSVAEIVQTTKAQELAIEETFSAKNVQSTIKLSEARAAAMVAAAKAGLEVYEYTPKQIKNAVVGYGGAQKTQVQYMIMQILGISGEMKLDTSDALACAICHANSAASSRAFGDLVQPCSNVRGRYRVQR